MKILKAIKNFIFEININKLIFKFSYLEQSLSKIKFKIIISIISSLHLIKLKYLILCFLKSKKIYINKRYSNPIFLYDLSCCALTFDFADYLFLTNIWLKKFGYKKCKCIVYLNQDDFKIMKFRQYNKFFSKKELLKRIETIIRPLAKDANFIEDFKIINNRDLLKKISKENFIIFPHYLEFKKEKTNMKVDSKHQLKILVNQKKDLTYQTNFLIPSISSINEVKKSLNISKKDKIITFTVRDYKFEKIRNTNYKFLKDLSKFFKAKNFRFIVIPDHKNQFPNINEEIFNTPTLDCQKRIAIYSIANINIGTAGGPVWIARYIPNTNMFITNICRDGDHIGSYRDLRGVYGKGFKWGRQPFLKQDMHIIYGPEDNIEKVIKNKRITEIMNNLENDY